MYYFLGALFSSGILGFIFKWFESKNIHVFQAIVVNYIVCVIVGSLVIGSFPINSQTFQTEWFPYALGLGVLFISGFNINALCVQKRGITLTAIVQKMSFVLSVLFAFIYFKEEISFLKIVAILLAVLSIYLSNKKEDTNENSAQPLSIFLWIGLPLLVFCINGIIESTLLFVQQVKLSGNAGLDFSVTLFGIAGFIGLIINIIGLVTKKLTFQWKNVLGGIILGIPNFFSIYLLLKVIELGWDGSITFPLLNVSIISFSAIIGAIFFKEKGNKWTWIGFGLALLSIACIVAEKWM